MSISIFPSALAQNGNGNGNGNGGGNGNGNSGNGGGNGNGNSGNGGGNGNGNSGNGGGNGNGNAGNGGGNGNANAGNGGGNGNSGNGNGNASLNPINQIPYFETSYEELPGDTTFTLDGLVTAAVDFLDDFIAPGLADGAPPGLASGGPPGLADGGPPGLAGGSPPGLAGGGPPGLAGGGPPGLALGKEKKPVVPPVPIRTDSSAPSYSENEVLAENLSPDALERARALGFSVEEEEDGEVTRLTVPANMTVFDATTLLQRELPDNNFHLNRIYRIYRPAANDGDTVKGEIEHEGRADEPCVKDRCYSRQVMQWKDDLGKCASKLKIGVVDTQVDVQHKTFAGQNILQKKFVPEGRKLADSGHGTGVLAILAGRPDSATPGLISEADFFVASIFFIGDDDSIQTDTVSLLKALQWMDRSGVQLVNMSFSGPEDTLLESRIDKLSTAGMVFAAAAGNEGLAAAPSYPAAYSQVIAVTAVDKKMRVYPSANRGDYIDLAAPGVHIWTALPNSRAGYLSGTSFAVPFMTAMLAIQRPETLRLPKAELLNQVRTVALEPGEHSRTFGRGLLQAPNECPNAARAVATGWVPLTEVSLR